jgi:hypothetical protein
MNMVCLSVQRKSPLAFNLLREKSTRAFPMHFTEVKMKQESSTIQTELSVHNPQTPELQRAHTNNKRSRYNKLLPPDWA